LRDTLNFTTDARSIFSLGSHGTAVLSTLCGHIPNQYIGSAMGAEYSLFVTEDTRFELPVEEANWLFAAEYADSMGVDIITSSLAYSTFDLSQYDHNHLQLDGKTAIISRAAQLASDKGILVFNAAANEGNKPWRKICFPADAQGVFSIGSVDSKRQYSSFSSVGNTTDGRIKPNVAALGTAAYIINGSDEVVQSNGTSFSTPLMAGAAATLMQAAPHKTAQEIQQALMQSASQYLHPDSLLGYGIPDLYLAYLLLQEEGIDKLAQGKITAIPNPFVQRFHLLYQSFGSEKINLNIFDYSGKLVWKKENITTQEGNNLYLIDGVSQLAQGNYILELRSNTQRLSLKLVKE
jgi:subtilisin family serine protease